MFLNKRQRLAGFGKQIAMAVKAVRHEVLLVPRPAALVHLRVQRGEEQILQDRLVEDGILLRDLCRGEPVEQFIQAALIEQPSGIRPFSFTNQQKINRVIMRITPIWSCPSASLGASLGKRTCFSAQKYQLASS